MADQPINDTDDIKEVDTSKWTKGPCPPPWSVQVYTEEYTQEYS